MKLISLTCILALLAAAGCRTLPPPPPVPKVAAAGELLCLLQARQAGLQSFQARGRLTLIAPGRSYSGSGRLKGRLPASLRVDVLDLFGRSMLHFASDGQQVEVLFPREGKMLYGPATPANLAAFVPPGVTLPQALKVLTGDLPLSAGGPDEWRLEGKGDAYLMLWRNPDGSLRERLWVDAQSLYPVKGEWLGDRGQPVFTAELGDFARDRPRQITFKTTSPETELRLAFQDMDLNPPLGPGDLRVPDQPGVEKIPFKP